MGIEQEPSTPKTQKEKKKAPKTTLYAPFNKEKHRKATEGVRIDVDANEERERVVIDKLDQELDKASEKDDALKERFLELSEKLQPGRLWIKVKVSDEVHEIALSGFEYRGRVLSNTDVTTGVKEGNISIKEVVTRFSLDKTQRVAGTLILHFKTPLTDILEGGGVIEEEHRVLITKEFAGTSSYYERLRREQEELDQVPERTEIFEDAKNSIIGDLKGKGASVTEMEGENIYALSSQLPGTQKQIHISTINKKDWNISIEEDQRTVKELFNLRPQEIISQIEEIV